MYENYCKIFFNVVLMYDDNFITKHHKKITSSMTQ